MVLGLQGGHEVVVVDRIEAEGEVEVVVRRYLQPTLILTWISTIRKPCRSTKDGAALFMVLKLSTSYCFMDASTSYCSMDAFCYK